ncbi:MAG TPA: oligopeptide transporter, OPT family [Pyrinomonadaceae bacterium]|nr:oligopeptide transporter, OPT family [Pyrinomonadaceae bacterium]
MKNPFLENFRPYIPDKTTLRELSILPLLIGTLLGIVFGASSLYLVLKTGLTVSASIPVAVIAITLFRLLSKFGARDATILEGNIMQTAGSAGESIAFGVGVTMPAIMILGFDLNLIQSTLVAVFGGLLGILLMIPLRRALIKEQHGYLKYPEGTACAEVLKAGASKESREASHDGDAFGDDDAALQGGKIIGVGFVFGFMYNVLMQVFSLWNPEPHKELSDKTIKGGSISLENNPALLGVGYIIGPYVSGIMLGGGVLSYLVLIPLIKFFGETAAAPIAPELSKTVSEMSAGQIRGAYILYIGAGAVAAAGIISLARSLPTIWSGLKSGLADLKGSSSVEGSSLPRTDQDISMKWVIVGIIALVGGILLLPQLGLSIFTDWKVSIVGVILILVLGFLFVTVSSRLTGEIGSSSNPISGMTVATLLITCLVFLALGWTTADPYFVTALCIGGIVCIAASNGGTTSQDLKTGFWVGGTPRNQQIAILFGALASALVLGWLLVTLNDTKTYYHKVTDKEFATEFRVTEDQLFRQGGTFKSEIIHNGPYKEADKNSYRVWQNTDPKAGTVGKFLIDTQGKPVYLVDPGINGQIKQDEAGQPLERYDAPKATLMSYIIKGILNQQLPWGLVLIGAMIAIMLELAGVPSLAFAVGLYLPISTSTPIFVGGAIRWIVDLYLRKKFEKQNLTKEQIDAETDKSNGVLMASGYIAGGAIAGIMVALFSLDYGFLNKLKEIKDSWAKWAETGNPFFAGDNADWLGMIPFLVLAIVLYFVGREMILSGKKRVE